jgi:Rha family phage regulatory protein
MPSEKTKSSSETEENLNRDKGPRLDSEPGILAKETDLVIEKGVQSGESVSNYIEDVSPKLAVIEGKPIISSLEVANIFGKEHYNVLRDIKALVSECSEEFSALNFEGVDYKDAKGEMRPSFNMNRDGFTMLAMGFTSKKAAAYRRSVHPSIQLYGSQAC